MSDQLKTCAGCGSGLQGQAQFGLCPACQADSFLTSTGPFGAETVEAEQFREHWRPAGGRFRLVRELGRGGMGEVWLAEDLHLGNMEVALKFLQPRLRGNEQFKHRLREELIQSRELQHPNIVKVYDWHEHGPDEPPCFSMQYVKGSSLAYELQSCLDVGLPYRRLHPLLIQVCEALDHAHTSKHLVHRDLKPANILLASERGGEIAKLSDFGLTRPVVEGQEGKAGNHPVGGTPAYMSPAQWQGAEPSYSDDIFALGVTMYQLMTGALPFGLRGCGEGELCPLGERNSPRLREVPPRVRSVVMNCLELDPEQRPRQIAQVLGVLKSNSLPEIDLRRPEPGPEPRLTIGAAWQPEPQREPSPGIRRVLAMLIVLVLLGGSGVWLRLAHPDVFGVLKAKTTMLAQNLFGRPNEPRGPRDTPPTDLGVSVVPAQPATLLVNCTPEGALVTIYDAQSALVRRARAVGGVAQFENLAAAEYRIEVSDLGYESKTMGRTLEPGRTAGMAVALERLLGSVLLRRAGGAELDRRFDVRFLADQKLVRTAHMAYSDSLLVTNLPAGRYVVCIEAPGHSWHEVNLEVSPGPPQTLLFSFRWVKPVFQVSPRVSATVQFTNYGSNVSLSLPAAPLDVPLLLDGKRQFWVTADGYTDLTTAVDVQALGQSATIPFELAASADPPSGKSFTNGVGMAFVWLPQEHGWIGRTEVTKAQFAQFAAQSGRDLKGMYCLTATGLALFAEGSFANPAPRWQPGEDHPVVGVNWGDAMEYCRWLTQRERREGRLRAEQQYTLPLGSQWQAACEQRMKSTPSPFTRGTLNLAGPEVVKAPYPWPSNWNFLVETEYPDDYVRTAPVGKSDYAGPEFDVKNLFDNVQEWCREDYSPAGNLPELVARYGDTLKVSASERNPWKVVCGGSWFDHDPMLWKPEARHCALAGERTDFRGFRVLLVNQK